MDKFREHFDLMEGVNDPSIFKAVFLAGGPGSGKSFVVGKTALKALGFRLINSDDAFEKGLKKAGLTVNPNDIASAQGQAVRAKAKALTGKIMTRALEGRMGIVIDGTGKDYAKIKKQVDMLRALGYAVHMIFVNTDLDTALDRNKIRPRSLPDDMVTKMWKDVQTNIGKFQGLFRQRMIVVDNSKGSDIEKAVLSAYKRIQQWAAKPPENAIAVKWIKGQKMKSFKELRNEGMEFWTVTVQKSINKLKKGQKVVVKARNSAEALKKGAKNLGDPKANMPGYIKAVKDK